MDIKSPEGWTLQVNGVAQANFISGREASKNPRLGVSWWPSPSRPNRLSARLIHWIESFQGSVKIHIHENVQGWNKIIHQSDRASNSWPTADTNQRPLRVNGNIIDHWTSMESKHLIEACTSQSECRKLIQTVIDPWLILNSHYLDDGSGISLIHAIHDQTRTALEEALSTAWSEPRLSKTSVQRFSWRFQEPIFDALTNG